ncbi:glycosyltransferase [Bythopirellula goksoeyrii]|uniref:Teichuronic acid biosynthesis glycosyltransferase TuaC n=1 Tax=Bythopirellula goksoeyrii TaxID=1400387 RepID=A0A5B9QCE9_9BACT|nr:glycosyltransferase [Bythopirellula goksoeyrii]QEG36648.1 Putative teichuronic acid biosynthesis glycosyltransferase TuaC [Bythopirellula goksoeyrii]
MRVLWVHNTPAHIESACPFIFILADEMRSQGIHVDLYSTGSLRGFARLNSVRRDVTHRSHDYDLVHAQFGSACAHVSARTPCRRIVSLRGTDLLGCDTGSAWWRLHGWAARRLTRQSLPSYQRVLVMSHRMRDELSRYHGRCAGVEVLPDGIDLQQFQPRERMAARRELGFSDDTRPWILFASLKSCNPVKRSGLAKAAFERAAAQRPDVVLQTISGKPHDEIPLWMSAANVLLMTSTREGWPNVVKEALACNVPFVSTNVSDLSRITAVEPSCVVADANPDKLAQGILTALETPPSKPLQNYVASMALPKIARQLTAIYHDTLQKASPIAA